MDTKFVPSRVFFFSFVFFIFVHCLPSNAFNVTDMLSQHPDFSSFNDALTRSQVASLINSRQAITVLALSNGAMSGVSGSQGDALKAILSLHVILDYFDQQKLQNMAQKSTILTTLYQTSGQANGMQGFLNVTVTNGGVVIGSAVPGSNLGSSLVKSVASQPYNISILQVSGAIIPPGIGGSTSPPSQPGASSPQASSPNGSPIIPLPPKFGNAPVPSVANSPTGSPGTTSPSPGGATPPSGAGATAPSAGGAVPPSGAGAMSPSAGGAMAPGATPPSGSSGGGIILPGNASAPSNAWATPPAGATAPSGAGATTPAGAMAPSDAGADSPGGAMPGNAPVGSPPMPAGLAPVADGPVTDAPAGGTSAAKRTYQSLNHASILITSLAVIWSVAQSM